MIPAGTVHIGDHVVARDAYNRLKKAVVVAVPREWRDRTGSEIVTTRGAFPKHWLWFPDTKHTFPWPAEDVFSDLAAAQAAVEANR